MSADDSLPDDVATLKAMLVAERAARMAAQGEAQHRALLIEKLQYTIRKMRHERFGQSSERGTLLDQLELQLADLEEDAAQAEATANGGSGSGREDRGAVVRAAQAGTPAAARASAAGTHRLSAAGDLPMLRRRDAAQDRRGRDRDAGARPPPVEGDPARAGEVLLPLV